jgi:hypothetical protein
MNRAENNIVGVKMATDPLGRSELCIPHSLFSLSSMAS